MSAVAAPDSGQWVTSWAHSISHLFGFPSGSFWEAAGAHWTCRPAAWKFGKWLALGDPTLNGGRLTGAGESLLPLIFQQTVLASFSGEVHHFAHSTSLTAHTYIGFPPCLIFPACPLLLPGISSQVNYFLPSPHFSVCFQGDPNQETEPLTAPHFSDSTKVKTGLR